MKKFNLFSFALSGYVFLSRRCCYVLSFDVGISTLKQVKASLQTLAMQEKCHDHYSMQFISVSLEVIIFDERESLVFVKDKDMDKKMLG